MQRRFDADILIEYYVKTDNLLIATFELGNKFHVCNMLT